MKKLHEININIARSLDLIYKHNSAQKAAWNFEKLLNTLNANHSILFVLNSFDEIDITGWIDIALRYHHPVYCLVRKNINKYTFLKMEQSPDNLEIFKNTLQPKCYDKFIKNESPIIDYVVFPMAIFNKHKYVMDNELNMNLSLLLSLQKTIKIGYAYSFQAWEVEFKKSSSLKIDYLITDDYFF